MTTCVPSSPRNRSLLAISEWAQWKWLVHGFSTRCGGVSKSHPALAPQRRGDLNLSHTSWDTCKNVAENRRRFQAALGASSMRLLVMRQIHSDLVRVIAEGKSALENPVGDGMVTAQPGLLLSILTADCLPVLLADVRQRVVAAIHCGWRGTLRRIAQKCVGVMKRDFSVHDADLRAAIGPGIRACCYTVGTDVAEQFSSQFFYADRILAPCDESSPLAKRFPAVYRGCTRMFPKSPADSVRLDLALAIEHQLLEAGLAQEHIWNSALCTCCHPELFFSYRRDGAQAGRMMGAIGIHPKSTRAPRG